MTQSMIEYSMKSVSSISNHSISCEVYLFLTRQTPVGQGLHIHEVSRPHTHSEAPQSVGLLWTSDQLVAETCTWQRTILTTNIHASVGFELTFYTV